jgi:ribonucleoside-diphosphate reductase alpha chain
MYSYDEVYNATLEYFGGDELAANVWISKYCLQDNNDNYLEKENSF